MSDTAPDRETTRGRNFASYAAYLPFFSSSTEAVVGLSRAGQLVLANREMSPCKFVFPFECETPHQTLFLHLTQTSTLHCLSSSFSACMLCTLVFEFSCSFVFHVLLFVVWSQVFQQRRHANSRGHFSGFVSLKLEEKKTTCDLLENGHISSLEMGVETCISRRSE